MGENPLFLRQLTYLVALDRFRHFSRAAEHCGVSQPALSSAIRQLEHELGVTIIRRRQRVLGLTPEGERVLAWARQSLVALDGLRQEADFAHEIAGGHISIGIIPPAQQLSPLLAENLRADIPGLHLEVTVANNSEIVHGLNEQRFDIGLIYLDHIPEKTAFETHELYVERHVLVAAPGIKLPGRTRCTWKEAGTLPLCLLDRSARSRQIIDSCFEKENIRPDVFLETNTLSLLHTELQAGRMASILPVAALPSVTTPVEFHFRRLDLTSAPSIGFARLRHPVLSRLLERCWKIASGVSFQDALVL